VPALLPSVGAAARRTARINQALLYLLLVALPLSGWSMVSAAGIQVSLFGAWSLPALLSADEATLKSLKLIHLTLNTLLFAALLLHVAAALRHGLLRDGVLARMLPRFGRGTST
jgi:cytochrome b561